MYLTLGVQKSFTLLLSSIHSSYGIGSSVDKISLFNFDIMRVDLVNVYYFV